MNKGMNKGMKKHNILKRILFILSVVLLLGFGAFFVYVSDYYRAEINISEEQQANQDITISTKDDYTIISPKETSEIGFIFYPGGKVDEAAYVPLLENLASEGITCVLVKMPFHLAVFGMNKADEVYALVPEVSEWYIGGHSLGGAMASSYALKHEDRLSGVVLLGAYASGEHEIPVITIYGSKDEVVNKEKLLTSPNRKEIEGGNHAYYGNYGEQKGDGKATIPREEQQSISVDFILDFIHNQ